MAEKNARKKLARGYFKEDLERYKNCTDVKPARQIKQETKALENYWNCYPFQYYRFDFYRKDCTLSLEDMKTYVPLFFLDALFYPANYGEYKMLSADKLMNYVWLKANEVPQAALLFCYDHNAFFNNVNRRINSAAVDAMLQASQAAKLFVKARQGSGGKGVLVFKKEGNAYVNDQGTVLDHSFFLNHLKNGLYIVQEGLVQHPSMNRLYPHAINTFRVITECNNGEARVLYALVRIGQGGKQVDNASSGGMYVKVDPETGALSDHAYAYNRITFDKHPDTGFVFRGTRLEEWDAVKTFALEVAEKLREMRYIGWDIGFTQSGPAVVELNNSPDLGMIQDFYGGVQDDLKINPKEWWYQSNFTLKNT